MTRQRIAAALAVLVIGAVPACSGGAERPAAAPSTSSSPTPTPTPTPSPTPVISEAEVGQAVADYFATRNRAAGKYDDKLIKSVASGPLLEQRLMDHKINRILKTKIPAVEGRNTIGTVTPPGTSPQRLVVETELQTEEFQRLAGLAERQRPGLPWSWRYAVNLDDSTIKQYLTTKSQAGDYILRTPTKAEITRLKMSPTAAVQQLAKELTSRTSNFTFESFDLLGSANQYRGEIIVTRSTTVPELWPSSLAFVTDPVVALQSSNGKVLVFGTIDIGWTLPVKPGTSSRWKPGPRAALAVKGRSYDTAIMYFEQLQVVIGIPPKGSALPEVLGIEPQLTGVGGV